MFRTLQSKKDKPKAFGIFKIATIITVLLMILSSLAVIYPPFFRYEDELKRLVAGCIFFILFLQIVKALVFVFLKSKGAKTTGDLILNENEITAEGMIYRLEHINKIRFVGNDVKGEFRGFISKGSNNQMILSLIDDVEKTFTFEQTTQRRLSGQKEILASYVAQGKLSKVNFDAIINNTNYF